MKRFAYGILGGLLGVFGTIGGSFAILALIWPASFPAPALTILIHLDEKLRFIRRNPDIDPRVLVMGSSIAWRQMAGAALESAAGGPRRVLNGGTANLQIHQSRDLLDFYLEHYEKVHTIVFMTNLPDFDDCTESPADMLDESDADAYAFRRWPAGYFYFRYFSPQRYVNAAMTLASRRQPFEGDLFLDDYGSGPVQVSESKKRGLRYGKINPDPACIDVFAALSESLAERGIQLVVVFPPVNPDYFKANPEAAQTTHDIASALSERAEADGTIFVMMYDDPEFAPDDFYDAFHLQWPGVQRLSENIASELAMTPERQASGILRHQNDSDAQHPVQFVDTRER